MSKKHGGGWNKGKTVGKKRPFTPEQVQLIRLSLQAKGDVRGLAMFEVAISTMLRYSDLARLTVGDVVSGGEVVSDFEIGQKKVRRSVKCDLSERARSALRAYLTVEGGESGIAALNPDRRLWLFAGRPLSYTRYWSMVKGWAVLAHADPRLYGTHSGRRTMPAHVYKETHDIEAARNLLGHASVASTSSYLDVSRDQAIAVKRKFEL